MEIDLVYRVQYLNAKGEAEPLERFNKWLEKSDSIPAFEFIVDEEKYYWKTISSLEFNDIIHEYITDWILIYSENREFEALGKRMDRSENLIGEKTEPYIPSLWILKSNIESIKVSDGPINIRSPYWLYSPLHRINYDFKQLITKLKDPNVKLIQYVPYQISKSLEKQIR